MSKKLLYGIGVCLMVLALGIGFWMWGMAEQRELWGYLPMAMLGFGWLGKMAFMSAVSGDMWRHLKAILAGLFFFLGFMPNPAFVLMFVGFVPLLELEKEIRESDEKAKGRKVWFYGFSAFLTWNILSTFWVCNTAFIPGVVAIVANSLLMTIPWLIFHKTSVFSNQKLGQIMLIVAWISFEKIHLEWELTWPWLTLGNAFASVPSIIQWYEFTGALGGSLWVLALNLWNFQYYLKNKQAAMRWKEFWKPIVIGLAFPITFSLYLEGVYKKQMDESKAVAVPVAVVQPNYEPHFVKFSVPDHVQAAHFMELSKMVIDEHTQYLLFPETSFGPITENGILSDNMMPTYIRFLAQYPKLKLVSGVDGYKLVTEAEKGRNTASVNGGTLVDFYNAAIQVKADTVFAPDYYVKSKLVPGAESFPFKEYLGFIAPIVDKLGGFPSGLSVQKEREVFWNEGESFSLAPVICYESIFGEYCTEYTKKGASFFAVLTNDGWWDNTLGHIQHMHFSSIRAIENRRPVVRSANSGISCVVDELGVITQATKYDTEASFKADIKQHFGHHTPYVEHGDLIARLAKFLTVLIFLFVVVKKLGSRTKPKQQ